MAIRIDLEGDASNAEATVIRLQKNDILEITIASDDVDHHVIARVKEGFEKLIAEMHGPAFARVVVFGVNADDDIRTTVIRSE